MSIVALKKNSRRFQANISGKGKDGFSLVGGYRNIGAVGPTNLAKSVSRTRFRGNAPMGHGGCCGSYKISISNSGSCCTNDPTIIKTTVKNNKGSILKQYKWIHSAYPNFWVKPDDSMPENYSQGIYVKNLTAKHSNCVLNKVDSGIYNVRSSIVGTTNFYPPTQGIDGANNTSNTLINEKYGTGDYYTTSSGSKGPGFRSGAAFDLKNNTIAISNNDRYSTLGDPILLSNTQTYTSSGVIQGDYWQITLPHSIYLYNFYLTAPHNSTSLPIGIVVLGGNAIVDRASQTDITLNTLDVLYEIDDIRKDFPTWNYSSIINVNLYGNNRSSNLYKKYNTFRIIVTKTDGRVTNAGISDFLLYEGVNVYEKNSCKSASYHIGGKKIYRSIYSKNLNSRPTSSSQYITAGLYKKNNLPTPPCLQSFPMNLSHNGCDVNYLTPQEAIDAGALPSDWMNCNPDTNPNCERRQY